ncbi:GMC oxidoreductase [Paenibacillus filicis]|uniref:GMC oxidoreductase n=1 Tax=Paenibacillus filicis TaxID=669464 RepID=A0ABU9DIY0_9BACL
MRIYMAKEGDTLRTIASQFHLDAAELHLYNPSVADLDRMVQGSQIRLPEEGQPSDIGMCPPSIVEGKLDHWLPLTPLEQMADSEYDVLIIGSGAGGGAVLWRLSEQWGNNGKKIGVVEAGDLFMPTHVLNVPTINFQQGYMLAEKQYKPIGPKYSGFVKKLVFGGGTLFWGAVTPRMLNTEIAKWPVPIQEMNDYYTIAERIMNVNTDFAKGSSFSEVLLQRLQQNGYAHASYRPMAVDLASSQYGMLHSNVFFSSIHFFARALNRRPVDIAVNARAVKVLIDNEQAVGVEVITRDQRKFALKAKKVVISASTFETPRILLDSGIQNRAIGHYLAAHSGIWADGFVRRDQFSEVLGNLSLYIPESDQSPFQVELQRFDKYYVYKFEEQPVLKDLGLFVFGAGQTESRYDNCVMLDPLKKDELGLSELQVHFSYSDTDKKVIRQALESVKHIVQVLGVTLKAPICVLYPGRARHFSGTCRIGTDPQTAAANPYGEIFGVSGLFVADNSALPSISAANPTLSTVALAIRTADHIIRQA